MDIKAPTEFCKPSITVVEDSCYKDSSHEVYFVHEKGKSELLYVGCGKKGRHKHVFSGSSQNVMLNVCFVFSVGLKIYVFGCKSKEEALEREAKGIEELKPKFNNVARDLTRSFKIRGKLSIEELSERFKAKEAGLAAICRLYEENPELCSYNHPDWFDIIDKVGVDICKSKGYQKSKIKPIYDAMLKAGDSDLIQRIHRAFFISDVYSSKDIKEKLIALGAPNPTGSAISRWFEVKKTVKNGVSAYRILHRRETFK